MRRPAVLAVWALLSVFFLGAALGAVTARFYVARTVKRVLIRPADQLEEQIVLRALERRAGLSKTQLAQARKILMAQRSELIAIRRAAIAGAIAVRLKEKVELMPYLSPEQQERLEQLTNEYVARQRGLLQDLAALER